MVIRPLAAGGAGANRYLPRIGLACEIGRASKVELISGIEGASSRPVRKIVLVDG